MLKILCHLILIVVHFFAWIKSIFTVYVRWIIGTMKHNGNDEDLIHNDAKRLKKIPFHLALIVCEEDCYYNDLVCMIWWAYTLGIQYVSIFDQEGKIKRDISMLRQLVQNYKLNDGSSSYTVHVISLDDAISTSSILSDFWLFVLSRKDGHQSLVNVAQVFCEENIVSDLPNHPSCIDNRMTLAKLAPDPDLAIVCGDTRALCGYPPWSSCLTEIMWLSMHKKPTFFDFYTILEKYSVSQQRHGK